MQCNSIKLIFYDVFSCMLEPSELTGLTNLMSYHGLEHSYHKFTSKKVKDELSAFLPNLPGNIDTPGAEDNRYGIDSSITDFRLKIA